MSDGAERACTLPLSRKCSICRSVDKIIDTPGMREFGIVDMSEQELSHYFPEMRALLHDCQFNDCMHINEPGCAIKKAVEDGRIAFRAIY